MKKRTDSERLDWMIHKGARLGFQTTGRWMVFVTNEDGSESPASLDTRANPRDAIDEAMDEGEG